MLYDILRNVGIDKIILRYAQGLFRRKEKILEDDYERECDEQEAKEHANALEYPSEPMYLWRSRQLQFSSEHHPKQIGRLCEAWAESLIEAYEKAAIPIDKDASKAIIDQVSHYCSCEAVHWHEWVNDGRFSSVKREHLKEDIARFDRLVSEIVPEIRRYVIQPKRDEVILEERKLRRMYAAGMGKKWDIFISHAFEDKEAFVRPLAEALAASGLSIWYDELALTVGDSLRRKIDEELGGSRYGIVVLSPNFFAKQWPQHELDGLYAKEVAGVKVILPVWYNIDIDGVRKYSPLLAGLLAATGKIEDVVTQLRRAMGI